jgi:hypothetical protein
MINTLKTTQEYITSDLQREEILDTTTNAVNQSLNTSDFFLVHPPLQPKKEICEYVQSQ